MTTQMNTRQPLRYRCPACGSEVARYEIKQMPAPVVDCGHCGTLCALSRPGEGSRICDAKAAIKIVPTGMAAIVRPV